MQVQVRAGMTLSHLAAQYGTTVEALAAANGIQNIHKIQIGQTLTVPGAEPAVTTAAPLEAAAAEPETAKATPDVLTLTPPAPEAPAPVAPTGIKVRVRAGMTLSSLAVRYNTTTEAIMQANGLTSDRIQIGQVLTVPGKDDKLTFVAPLPRLRPRDLGAVTPQPDTVAIAPVTSSLSGAEIEALTRAVAAEARGESHAVQVAVAQAIINYARKHDQSIPRLVRTSYLSSNFDGNKRYYTMPLSRIPNHAAMRQAVLEAGQGRAPIGDRSHFHDTSINTPRFGDRRTRVQIGHMVFYNAKNQA